MVGNILWGQRASMQDFTAARQIVVVIPVVISQPRQTVICMDAQSGLGLRDSAIKMVFDPSFSLPPFLCLPVSLAHTVQGPSFCCSRHAGLLISWLCNYIRMLFVLSEMLLVIVWAVCVCVRWVSMIAKAWSQGLLSEPSEIAASTLCDFFT